MKDLNILVFYFFSMGGGKRKFNQVRKFIPKDKKIGKFVEGEKVQHKPEDVKNLIDLWMSKKKKEDNN